MAAIENIGKHMNKGPENLPGISAQKPPRTHIHHGFAFETHLVTSKNLRPLRVRAHRFEGYVGYDVIDAADQIRYNIRPSTRNRQVEVEFVKRLEAGGRDKGSDVGVVTQAIVDLNVGEQHKRGLDIGVKAVDPKLRGRDLGFLLLVDALLEHEDIDFVTGQSRNGRVFRYLEKAKDQGLLEEIRGYQSPLAPEDLEVLEQTLSRRKYNQVSRLRTGLCLRIYPKTASELFIAPPNNPEAVRIVDHLKSLRVEPGGVNGIRYFAPVNKEVVKAAREEYERTETVESVRARYFWEEAQRIIGDFFKRPAQMIFFPARNRF